MLAISRLLNAALYDHPVSRIELIETHISWVILTGPFAYKVKKPVNFGFLDFSSLEKRKHACEEELRLNRRLAPRIYLAVVPLCGTLQQPRFGSDGEIIEYAVKMQQFPQARQLDRMLQDNKLHTEYLDVLAERVARFHLAVDKADATVDYGDPATVWQPVAENFDQVRQRESNPERLRQLDRLYHWSRQSYEKLTPVFEQRKRDGFVRECHGDLHLRNIAWVEDAPVIFDCIEFNPRLRWIDVSSDLAFLFMDLIDRGQSARAYRLLDRYLVITGDYAGLAVLPFYFVYRAMVRAKVDCLRLSQADVTADERQAQAREYVGYLNLAERFVQQRQPILMITWGLSASGKSTVSSGLLETIGAIRLRSDVERKRLAGLAIQTSAAAAPAEGIYTPDMSRQTYGYLLSQAAIILSAGFPVIVDAAFLETTQRAAFARLATQLNVPFVILQCIASTSCLRERICRRQNDVSDADLGILEHQLLHYRPLSPAEQPDTIQIDTEQTLDIQQLVQRIQSHIAGS